MKKIGAGEVVILDGPMGTEIQKRGAPMDDIAWCATAIRTNPEIVRAAHEDYIRAGADVITANTFATARHVLAPAGLAEETAFFNRRAVELAIEARENATAERPVWVAGSVSSMVGGVVLDYKPTLNEVRAHYQEQVALLTEAGVDLILLEMMMDHDYAVAAAEAAATSGLPVWVGFSCRVDETGTVRMFREGHSEPDLDPLFEEVIEDVMASGGTVAGVMHTELAHVGPALDVLKSRWSGPLMIYAEDGDKGMPIEWRFVDLVTPDAYAAMASSWVEQGVQAVGGCCGLGVEHIAALKRRLPSRLLTRRTSSGG